MGWNPGRWVKRRLERLGKDIKHGINKLIPTKPYCVFYTLNTARDEPQHRQTMHSRLGMESIRAMAAARLGNNATIQDIKSGGCSKYGGEC